jgi:hypothetical protein
VKIHQDKRGRSCDGPVKIHRALISPLRRMRGARISHLSRGNRPADRGDSPMTDSLNPADLATYTAKEVASLADVDVFAVRAEGFRRQTAAEKKIARARKMLEQGQREMAESHLIIEAAFREMDRAAA